MSVTALHVPFKKELEPIALVNEFLEVRWSDGRSKFYRVKFIEPIFLEVTTPSVNPQETAKLDLEALELGQNELGHIRLLIQTDDFEVEVKQPEAVSKYSLRNGPLKLKKWVTDSYPQLAELYYWEDNVPTVIVKNVGSAAATCTIRIVGFRYQLEEVKEKPERATVVYVETIPSPQKR